MATAIRKLTPLEWQARAIALATDHHLTGRARYLGTGVVSEALYQVPSRTAEGSCHVVKLYHASRQIVCSCTAGTWGRPCSHAGAALHAERQRQAAMSSPQDEPLRSFAHGLSW